ncbi:MAG: hypothetical protein Kow0092_21490 [Deferrisomatales bacterium]
MTVSPPRIRPAPTSDDDRSFAVGAGLRDLFICRDVGQLLRAYATLRAVAPGLPPCGDPELLEFAYNRLFVGPKPPVAPLYASAYLDPERRTMGTVTLTARRVYRALGVASPLEGTVPDDHLSLEIDALLLMRRATEAAGAGPSHPVAALRRGFLADHVLQWVPRLWRRALQAPAVPPPLEATLRLLESWLARESRHSNEGVPP